MFLLWSTKIYPLLENPLFRLYKIYKLVLRKNESEVFRVKIAQRKVTKCNTYNNSFFVIAVLLQFSIKVYFSGCLVLITNSKLVISVGKRRGFSRRFWLLIKELLIARDADRRNKTPYINVSFLEFDFLESHIFLEMFILTNKNHSLLDNPPFSPTVDLE